MDSYQETIVGGIGLAPKTGSLITKPLPRDGNRIYVVEIQPSIEPITVDELKSYASIDYSDHDGLLEGFIKAVRSAAEDYTGRSFIEQTIALQMDFWPGTVVDLPSSPLMSVTKVATLSEDDEETEYDSDNYYILTSSEPGKLVLKRSVSEPTNTERDYGGFLIRFKAGYGGAATDVPQGIREAIKIWAAVAYSSRFLDPKNPPPEAKSLLKLYRTVSVMIR